jgi:hypothetical protein
MIATRALAVLCVALLMASTPDTFAQQQPAGASQDQQQKPLTAEQLDSLVAPIALFPDPILSQVLVASTYPLEVVEAGRWIKQQPNVSGKALADAAAKQPWDASVQALILVPDALKRLDQNITWTSDLGNAFLAQQQDVMDAIQRMRKSASDRGALQTTPQQTVSTTSANGQTYVEIQPASTQVVYVPEYNPAAVWGPAPDYYPYPAVYYPPYTGAYIAAGAITFGVGVAVGAILAGGWNNWGWNFGWGGRNVIVNNNFINNNRFNRVNVGNGNAWVHNPAHRGGVPYSNRAIANRFQGMGDRSIARPTVAQTQQRLNQAGIGNRGGAISQPGAGNLANRAGMPGAPGSLGQRGAATGSANRLAPGNPASGGGDRIGNRGMQGSVPQGMFGGMNQGGNRAFMNSNRGFASAGGFHGGGFRGGGFRGGGRRR